MKKIVVLFIMVCGLSFIASAQDDGSKNSGFNADIIAEMDYVSGQVLKLLDAVPEDKLSWKPSEGVRSFGEVFSHIVEGNYFLLSFVGNKMPDDMKKELKTKAEFSEALKKSYEVVKEVVPKLTEEDLAKPVDFFGNKSNQRRMVLVLLYHSHEHLGQAIAYARMNGITPPWSMSAANK